MRKTCFHSQILPFQAGNSAVFCKQAKLVAAKTASFLGFVETAHCIDPHYNEKHKSTVKSVRAKFPWVLPLKTAFFRLGYFRMIRALGFVDCCGMTLRFGKKKNQAFYHISSLASS
ncbi:hypothetical protein Y032_0001g397 [Ancylostoma ceylanicum]|uniref:Uncharacterized protein n=1 Tax=Ancylostoma ceylanicum TaxID=53326 RepID=A0A016W529_9BILA|nr:hypothetical protein Y032_0001g397 [Ancylostoma ceylanicum]